MIRLLLVFAMLALGGCDPAVSRRPLLTEGGSTPHPGLWALLEPDCPNPTSSAVQTWPECATPVWVRPGEATTIVLRHPVRSALVLAAGEPRIAQVAVEGDVGEPRYSYFAFRPQGAAPHRSALMWFIVCEGDRDRSEEEGECLVEDEGELRRLAKLAVGDPAAAIRAVHIGPG